MDISTILALVPVSPALLLANPGMVAVLLAWLRAPIEEFLPQSGPTDRLNSFWLKLANLALQLVLLGVEYAMTGAGPTVPAVAALCFMAMLSAFGAEFGYQSIIKAKKSSDAKRDDGAPATPDDTTQNGTGADTSSDAASDNTSDSATDDAFTYPTIITSTPPFQVNGSSVTVPATLTTSAVSDGATETTSSVI